VQMATSYEPAELTAQTPVPFPEQGPFAGRGVIERMKVIGVHVDQVVEEISVRPSLSAEAAALEIPAGAPVLLIERAHRAGPRTVEAGEIIIAADRFRLRYRIPVAAGPGQDGAAGQDRAAEGSPAKDSAAQNGTAQTSTAQNGTAGNGTGEQPGPDAGLVVGAGVSR